MFFECFFACNLTLGRLRREAHKCGRLDYEEKSAGLLSLCPLSTNEFHNLPVSVSHRGMSTARLLLREHCRGTWVNDNQSVRLAQRPVNALSRRPQTITIIQLDNNEISQVGKSWGRCLRSLGRSHCSATNLKRSPQGHIPSRWHSLEDIVDSLGFEVYLEKWASRTRPWGLQPGPKSMFFCYLVSTV